MRGRIAYAGASAELLADPVPSHSILNAIRSSRKVNDASRNLGSAWTRIRPVLHRRNAPEIAASLSFSSVTRTYQICVERPVWIGVTRPVTQPSRLARRWFALISRPPASVLLRLICSRLGAGRQQTPVAQKRVASERPPGARPQQ